MNPKVAVVILNWNGKNLLERFLPSVIEYSMDIAEIIIADNNSSDDSIHFLENKYPDIRLIRNSTNEGFAKGYNTVLKQIEADYYILLNSDIEVTPHWIEGVINFMEKDKSIAACQPKILSYNDKSSFEYAGAAGGFIDKLGYPFCRGRLFQTLENENEQYDDILEIFWATGACLFIRADLFHCVGGFDEDFFAHMEEIDLCWRLKNATYKIYYFPHSAIYHVGGATLDKMSPQKTYLNFRNNLSLIYKNIVKTSLKRVLFKRAILDFIAAISFIFSGGFSHFWAVIRAYMAFYKSMGKIKEKRKHIEQKQVSCIYNKSIVKEYYFNKKKFFFLLNERDFS